MNRNAIQTSLIGYNEMESEQATLFMTFVVTQSIVPRQDLSNETEECKSNPPQKPFYTRLVNVEEDYHDAQEEFMFTNFCNIDWRTNKC